MATPKHYFIRTADSQKGPYTWSQMKASLRAKALSPHAEYRTGDDEPWRPIKELADKIAAKEAEKDARDRVSRTSQEPLLLPKARTSDGPQKALSLVLAVALLGGMFLCTRLRRASELGRPCRSPQDCGADLSCLQSMDEDRNISAEGYCTFPCKDSSDCGAGMICGQAVQTDPQGTKWNGMIRKDTRLCMRR